MPPLVTPRPDGMNEYEFLPTRGITVAESGLLTTFVSLSLAP